MEGGREREGWRERERGMGVGGERPIVQKASVKKEKSKRN